MFHIRNIGNYPFFCCHQKSNQVRMNFRFDAPAVVKVTIRLKSMEDLDLMSATQGVDHGRIRTENSRRYGSTNPIMMVAETRNEILNFIQLSMATYHHPNLTLSDV